MGQAPELLRVLVVENDVLVRRIFTRAFQKLGVEAVIAEGGADALAAMSGGAFGLVLIDMHLDAERGSDVLARLRPLARETARFVCISGVVERPGGASDGFDGFEAKPATVEQMAALLGRWST
jgi:CheY-like chemotaxis protein